MRLVGFAAVLALAVACSGGSTGGGLSDQADEPGDGPGDADDRGADVSSDPAGPGDFAQWPDDLAADPGSDPGFVDDHGQDLGPDGFGDDAYVPEALAPDGDGLDVDDFDYEPEPGAFLWPCLDNADCDSGVCIFNGIESVCTMACVEECPQGWKCAQYKGPGPDLMFVCLPVNVYLCKPCLSDADCMLPDAVSSDRCVSFGDEGAFCGVACAAGDSCPEGYGCLDVSTVLGLSATQCVPAGGKICECSDLAVTAGASTDCAVTNEFGSCVGVRSCTMDGLSACDADVPNQETCNAADDDCDGQTDEGFDPVKCGQGDCGEILQPTCVDGLPLLCNPFHGAGEEVCNGKDDDCNGEADDGLVPTPCLAVNQYGGCPGWTGCAAGKSVCNAKQEAAPEECDGIDNDCDGDVDEGGPFPGVVEICNGEDDNCNGQVDEQDAVGCSIRYLDLDKDGWGETEQAECLCASVDFYTATEPGDCEPFAPDMYPGAAETCNGKDNDCDGLTDEDLGATTCGVGQCFHTVENCAGGLPVVCSPLDGATDEECDEEDNDCDGKVDEGFGTTTCGVGPCLHSVENCYDGELQVCNPMQGTAPEKCDGKDNDCDGVADDGFGATTCGLGICLHTIENCAGGDLQVCDPLEGADDEVCDGADNDCDGVADDGFGATTCGLGICLHTIENCAGGDLQVCDPLEGADDEVCDGADNDCDGLADDGFGTTTCGLGVCLHTIENCAGGKLGVCDPTEGADDEVCDGADNDCDGWVDEPNALDCAQYFADGDGDGVGDPEASSCLCGPEPAFPLTEAGDCSDEDSMLVTSCDLLGTGVDGDVTAFGKLDLNQQGTGGRQHPDGVAWKVISSPFGASLSVESTAGFASGDQALVIELQGPAATTGTWEVVKIAGIGNGTLELEAPLTNAYGAPPEQLIAVQRIPQYENLTLKAALTASQFDGLTSGDGTGRATGIVAVKVSGVLSVEAGGSIAVSQLGFRGSSGPGAPEGAAGYVASGGDPGAAGGWADGGKGGGAAGQVSGGSGAASCSNKAGALGLGGSGGGGKITQCAGGSPCKGGGGGGGGSAYDGGANPTAADLSILFLGGGASAGAAGGASGYEGGGGQGGTASGGGAGNPGGGVALVWARHVVLDGLITALGGPGGDGVDGGNTNSCGSDDGAGGGGEGGAGAAGGTVLLSSPELVLAQSVLAAQGGVGGNGGKGGNGFPGNANGGAGGAGALPGALPGAGANAVYSGDGGGGGGGGAGGASGATGVLRIQSRTVNGAAFASPEATAFANAACGGSCTSLAEWVP